MQTIVNFRDMGGYPTPKGNVVKGKFYRSGELYQISDSDKEAVQNKYNIKHIFDFRKKAEVIEKPDDTIEGVQYYHIDIMRDEQQDASFHSMLETTGSVDLAMMRIYKSLILDKTSQEFYKEFLESVYNVDQEAILFHCFAGKDRTGFGAAIILKILGVSDTDIYTDYLKTNAMRKAENEAVMQKMREEGASEEELQRTNDMLSVKKEYLDYAFSLINETYGSFSKYVEEGLLLDDAFISAMQERFIIK